MGTARGRVARHFLARSTRSVELDFLISVLSISETRQADIRGKNMKEWASDQHALPLVLCKPMNRLLNHENQA